MRSGRSTRSSATDPDRVAAVPPEPAEVRIIGAQPKPLCMCGRPVGCTSQGTRSLTGGSITIMYPACWRDSMAAGPDGFRDPHPNTRAALPPVHETGSVRCEPAHASAATSVRGYSRKKRNHPCAARIDPRHRMASLVHAVQGEDGLGRVDADADNLTHGRLRSWWVTTQIWRAMPWGRPPQHLNGASPRAAPVSSTAKRDADETRRRPSPFRPPSR